VRPLTEVIGQELLWVQPEAVKREHELRAADEVVATLEFQRRTTAAGVAADGQWAFRRAGLWRPEVIIRVLGSASDLAFFHPQRGRGGELDFPDGRLLHLGSSNFWQSGWVWRKGDNELMRFRGRDGRGQTSCAVEIAPRAAHMHDLALLALLGWYIILLYAKDTDAAAAVGTVASATAQ
jgi:hypothetical protein